MPFEMNPHIRRIVEKFGCPNIASSDEAHRRLTDLLCKAEVQLERITHGDGHSPLMVVRRTARDILMNRGVIKASVNDNDGSVRIACDVEMLSSLLALMATAATSMLKDMAFLYDAGLNGSCSECEHRGRCGLMSSESSGEDEEDYHE